MCSVRAADSGYWDGRLAASFSAGPPIAMKFAIAPNGHVIATQNGLSIMPLDGPAVMSWDGTRWSILADQISNFNLLTLANHDGGLIAGGKFTQIDSFEAANVARLIGTNWAPLGSGLGGRVAALYSDGASLWAGGEFTNSGPNAISGVARWDGTQWHPVGDGLPGAVKAVVATNGVVYAGWTVTNSQHRISCFQNGAWQTLGEIAGAELTSLVWFENSLYVSGRFTVVNGVPVLNVAQWREGQWSNADFNFNLQGPAVIKLVILNDELHLHGPLSRPDPADWLRRTVSGWENVPFPYGADQSAVIARGNELFVASMMPPRTLMGAHAPTFSHFDGSNWFRLNNGHGEWRKFTQLAPFKNGVIMAFNFMPNWFRAPVFWDGADFHTTTNGSLTIGVTIANIDGHAYVPATQTINGQTTDVLARLDGRIWAVATAPLPIRPTFLVGNERNIYAAGLIGSGANALAEVYSWDGASWSRLGGSFSAAGTVRNGSIASLALMGGQLIAGGTFTNIGPESISYLARWDGQSWQPLGNPNGRVADLAVAERLHVVGAFQQIGGAELRHAAAWDGDQWSGFGSGFTNATPMSIAVSADGKVAVTGDFPPSPGEWNPSVMIWRGTEWERLGQSDTGTFQDSLWIGHDLYVTGDFSMMNRMGSSGMAIWHEPGVVLHSARREGSSLEAHVSGALPPAFVMESSSNLQAWTGALTNLFGASGQKVRLPLSQTNEFFRLRKIDP